MGVTGVVVSGLLPAVLTVQAAWVCGSPRASFQVWATSARCAVGQARVGPVVVAVDVSADHLPGLVEGLELVQPDAALLEL